MRSISGLTEAASLFIGFVVAVEGFVAPCAHQHQAPLQYRRHQHEHLVVTPGSRLASFCGSSSRTASTHPLRMNKTGGGSQVHPLVCSSLLRCNMISNVHLRKQVLKSNRARGVYRRV